jgi:hypothetical protein
MLGHFIFIISTFNIEVAQPFTYSTILILLNQVLESCDLSERVDLKLRANLETNFHFGWGNKWAILICLQKPFLDASRLIDELATKDFDEDLS